MPPTRQASFEQNLGRGIVTFSHHLFPIPRQETLGVAARAGKNTHWITGLKQKSERVLIEIT